MEKELGGLPEGWVNAAIGDICCKVTDGSHNPPKASDNGKPMLSAKNIYKRNISFSDQHRIISDADFVIENNRTQIQGGDVLLTIVGALGRSAVVPENCCPFTLQRSVAVLRAENISPYFLNYFFESMFFQEQILANAKGTAQKGIYLNKLRELVIKLPSIEEQKIIIAKLDSLLAQVDSIKTRLDQIPQVLKRFRQAVLSAAVSGKLSGNVIAEELFKPLGNTGLIIKTGPFGSALHKSDYVFGGISIINPMHINDGVITASESMTISDTKYSELESWGLKDGDVVVGRRGEMGRAAVVRTQGNKMLCGTGSMILRAPSNALPKYLEFILRSPLAIHYFNSESVGSTMVNLNQKVISNLNVFFPSLEEQTEIVARVEKLFAWADNIEKQVNTAQQRVNNLTQSILAKAFRGELTEQWRKDHPELISGENSAAALLEKIKIERAAQTKKSKKKA